MWSHTRRWTVGLVVLALIGGMLNARAAAAAAPRYVATTGTDIANDCLTAGTPCATIGYAVSVASSGDTVVVAAGTYPEVVSVNKDLVFQGANAGVAAGANPGVRGPESIVKGFRNPGNPGTTQYSFTLDGFQIDPQGDTALISASAQSLVWIFGGPSVQIVNNVFVGAATYNGACSYTCTTMTDYALSVNSGAITVSDNTITNFRRPANISMTNAAMPVVSADFERNSVTGFTSRALSLGQSTGLHAMPGVNVTDNVIDGTGWTAPSSPGGIIISQDSNVITGNTISGTGSGIYVSLCRKWSTQNQVITGNTFSANQAGVNFDDYPLTIYGGLTSQCYSVHPSWGGNADGTVLTDNNFVGNTSYGIGGWYYTQNSNPAAFNVSVAGATNASPIVISTSGSNGLSTGASVTISGATGNTAANGTWTITRINSTTFSLNGSTGDGAYTGGGIYNLLPLPTLPSPQLDATCNWWGAADGPAGSGPGSGDAIGNGYDYLPWRVAAAPGGACTGGTNVAPTASFTATPASGDAPLPVAFDASTSTDSDGTIVSYDWDFGDATTGSGLTTSHTYTTAGTYVATLTVTDDDGATDTATETIVVTTPAPTPNTKKVTRIYGSATIPSTVSGNATVSFNVKPFVFFGQILFYTGSANYSDPAAGKQANGLVLLGGSAIARYGLNGAQFNCFGFGAGFKSGSINYKIDDLDAIGQGADTVQVAASGSLAYVNPGGAVTGGNITVLPL